MTKTIKIKGLFNKIEDALHYYYQEVGLSPFEVPFNTFEASLFIEEYLKIGNRDLKVLYRKLTNKNDDKRDL